MYVTIAHTIFITVIVRKSIKYGSLYSVRNTILANRLDRLIRVVASSCLKTWSQTGWRVRKGGGHRKFKASQHHIESTIIHR